MGSSTSFQDSKIETQRQSISTRKKESYNSESEFISQDNETLPNYVLDKNKKIKGEVVVIGNIMIPVGRLNDF